MIFFIILIILGCLALIYMLFEATLLKVSQIHYSDGGLTVMQISDIHIDKLMVSDKKIVDAIKNNSPDIIILSGDFIEKPSSQNKFFNLLNSIVGFCPIYAVFGNHDYDAFDNQSLLDEFQRKIEAAGVKFLLDDSIIIEKEGKKYNLTGFKDFKKGNADICAALKSINNEYPRISFSHNPDIITNLPKNSVDFLFCGHYHGGQIRLPFHAEFNILRKDILCKKGIRKGRHKIKGIELYINNGIGNVLVPMRFLSVAEISVYHI